LRKEPDITNGHGVIDSVEPVEVVDVLLGRAGQRCGKIRLQTMRVMGAYRITTIPLSLKEPCVPASPHPGTCRRTDATGRGKEPPQRITAAGVVPETLATTSLR